MVGCRSSGSLGTAVLPSGGGVIGTGPEAILVGADLSVGAEVGDRSRGVQVWLRMDPGWGQSVPDEGTVLLL